MAKLDYDALNSMQRYMMISVFAVQPEALGEERAAVIDETATFLKQQEEGGVVRPRVSTTSRVSGPTPTS